MKASCKQVDGEFNIRNYFCNTKKGVFLFPKLVTGEYWWRKQGNHTVYKTLNCTNQFPRGLQICSHWSDSQRKWLQLLLHSWVNFCPCQHCCCCSVFILSSLLFAPYSHFSHLFLVPCPHYLVSGDQYEIEMHTVSLILWYHK